MEGGSPGLIMFVIEVPWAGIVLDDRAGKLSRVSKPGTYNNTP